MEFDGLMSEKLEYVETVLKSYMPEKESFQKTVIDAMRYTISAGGKRIRPILMCAVYEMLGGKEKICEPFMAAIEMIHTYSLIHDDLPALDNDDYRRGRKTAHIVYGEAMAILAGDALLNYAFETASKAFDLILPNSWDGMDSVSLEEQVKLMKEELSIRKNVEEAMKILAHYPGIDGMIGGQVVDVELTGKKISNEELVYIYENKTGALIEASMLIGAILCGCSSGERNKIQKIAYNIGMAFQIQDDILDEISTFEELGKPIHSDAKNEKYTYVTLYSIEKAKEEVRNLSNEAIQILDSMQGDSTFLKAFIQSLIQRRN